MHQDRERAHGMPWRIALAAFVLGAAVGWLACKGPAALDAVGYALSAVLNPFAAPIEGTRWELASLGARRFEARGTRPYLQLRGATIGGFNGCTVFTGQAMVMGSIVRITNLAMPPLACPPGDPSHAVMAALRSASRLAVRGRELELRDAQGRTLARFEAVR